MAMLRLRARGSALVQDHEALALSPPVRRYIGRQLVELTPLAGSEPARHAYIDTGDVVAKSASSPFAALYLEDICLGALWPADEATAQAAEAFRRDRHPGRPPITFDPTFGGDEPPAHPSKEGG